MTARAGSGTWPASRLELDERWARAAWAFLAEPRDREVIDLLGSCGAVEALSRLRAGRLPERNGWEVRLPELDLDGMSRAARHHGVRVLVPGDDEWPAGLLALRDQPDGLFGRGRPDLAALVERSVSVVGSRAATDYGLRVAGDLAEGLAARGFTVVSGAAYGIDAAAHRAALAAEAPTVAVLACGADRAYPTVHRGMIDQVAAAGAVVSEVPIGCAPYRSRFLARNRLIATLSRATVVVEANLRSGSLTTARAALDHHLPVGAVPGPVTSMTSAGCHSLVRDGGAVLVTDAAEVAELAARIGDDLLPGGGSRGVTGAPGDDLDEESYGIWSAVPLRGGASTERLASASGVEPRRLLRVLALLEGDGLVRREGGLWRKSRATSGDTTR